MPMVKAVFFSFVSLFFWWSLSPLEKTEKKKISSFAGDAAFSFLFFSFLFQLLFHLSSILRSPYELMMLSAKALEWGLVFSVVLTGWKYRQTFFAKPLLYKGWMHFLLMTGIVNHLYVAFLYGQGRSLIAAVLMLVAFISLFSKNLPSWILMGLPLFVSLGQWILFMNQSILYFDYYFSSVSFVLAAFLWTAIVIYHSTQLRRSLLSE